MIDSGIGGQAERERMLAPSATNEKYAHGARSYATGGLVPAVPVVTVREVSAVREGRGG